MRQRDGLALVITLLVGVGLGWILASVGGSGPAGSSPAGPDLPVAVRRPSGLGEAELRGRAESPPPPEAGPEDEEGTSPEDGRAAVEAVIEHVGEEGIEEFVIWEEFEGEGLGQRAWQALLTLYAASSRQADFLRAVPKAMAADVGASDVLECVGDAPPKTRAQFLDALRAALPDVGWSVGHVADLYIGAGALDRAVAVLIPALEETKDADLALRLVRASPERASSELAALLSDGIFTASSLADLGKAFIEKERGELAVPFLLESLRLEPKSGETLMALAGVDAALGASHAEALIQEDPKSTEAWNWLGKIRAQGGDAEAAFEAFKRSAENRPTTEALYGMLDADPTRALEVASGLATDSENDEVHGAVAKIAMQAESMGVALDAVIRAHANDPVDHEWLRAMVTLDPARALTVLDETLVGYSGDERDEVIGARANALKDLGRRQDAFDSFLEAHELDKGDWEWQRGMARSDPARAFDVLQAYRQEGDADGDLLGAIGDAYAGMGRSGEAMRHYELALEKDGGTEWLARMAQVDHEAATKRIQTAIDAKPREAELWFELGEAHALAGRHEEATAAYAQAAEIEPRNLYYGAKLSHSR